MEIIRTIIKEDSKHNSYVEYVLEVVYRGRKWVFQRRWKDFSQLSAILANLFDPTTLPCFRADPFTAPVPKKEEV